MPVRLKNCAFIPVERRKGSPLPVELQNGVFI